MKIMRFVAEHVKKLRVVEITPSGNVVQVTGKNGAGKTSVLDCIAWALAGARAHQSEPINRDYTHARIQLDLGDGDETELVVEREFARKPPAPGMQDERITTRITVTAPDGQTLRSPQTILDKLIGSLSFDPLAFARADEDEQYRMLQQVCGVDLSKADLKNEQDYSARRVANRTARDRRAAAESIILPTTLPPRVNVGALLAERRQRETTAATRTAAIAERDRLERKLSEAAGLVRSGRRRVRESSSRVQAVGCRRSL